MSKEILDVVNENDEVVGKASRDDCHKNPKLIHRVVHCWIINSKGQFLFQQRSLKKKESPGKWDISCGGHIPAGEEPLDGLMRELEEELGVKDVQPVLVEKYLATHKLQTELIHLYYCFVDEPESYFRLQKEEVEQVKWFDLHTALEHCFDKEKTSTVWIYSQLPRIYQKITSNSLSKAYWVLPENIKKVGFDFRWDIKKVWELDLPVEEMGIEELEWHLDTPFWFNPGGFYDLTPRQVIERPKIYKKSYERVMNTDLTYPLDIMKNKGRWVLLDGLNRLARHYIEGAKTVKVRRVTKKDLPKILN